MKLSIKKTVIAVILLVVSLILLSRIPYFTRDAGKSTGSQQTSIFRVDNSGVYYTGGSMGEVKISGADPASFEFLGGIYGKDTTHVYSCQVECKVVSTTSADTFNVIDNSTYASDGKTIYKDGEALANIDPASFKVLNVNYYADLNGIYLNGQKIKEADAATFRVLDDLYAADNAYVYYESRVLEGADPSSFQVLQNLYARDDKQVYFNGDIVPGADPKTFKVISQTRAKDKSNTYENGALTQSTNAGIAEAFSRKYKRPISSFFIEIEAETGAFAKGSVGFKGEFDRGIWIGALTANGWELVHDGQGPASCENADKYNLPTDLAPECVDIQNGNVLVTR